MYVRKLFIAIALVALAGCNAAQQQHRSLLLISLDGFRPDYLTRADEHQLKIPYLRKLLNEGACSGEVRGVLPTSTYPSHTTIVTGVSPAHHGIIGNKPWDLNAPAGAWNWYAETIRVPTLFDAAAARHMSTGAVSWPVTVGAKSIQYNIPEYNQTRSRADLLLTRALAGTALMDELAKTAGPLSTDVNDGIGRDQSRTRYALELIRKKKVQFLAVHLAMPDHLEHEFGPFTPQVNACIEQLDPLVRDLHNAMLQNDPSAIIAIVSDHGFSAVNCTLRINSAFAAAHLDGVANVWIHGGSATVTLNNRDDVAARQKVEELLQKLAADKTNGIAKILEHKAIAAMGGADEADYWIDCQPGVEIGSGAEGAVSVPAKPKGTHGYAPTHAEMNSIFLVAGKGIANHRDLGPIDMRNIAPTLARLMQIDLPTAELPALDVYNHGS